MKTPSPEKRSWPSLSMRKLVSVVSLTSSSACAAFSIISDHKYVRNSFAVVNHQQHRCFVRPQNSPKLKRLSIQTNSATALFVSNNENPEGLWETPNDFRALLNQCTIQSFMFLLHQLRDPQTLLWLDEFTSPNLIDRGSDDAAGIENYSTGTFVEAKSSIEKKSTTKNSNEVKLLKYHGLGAMNTTLFPTWDSYFLSLLKERSVTFVVESDVKHIKDYDLDINPASLCSRILSVRSQIMGEWYRDLNVIITMGGRTMESYWDNIREARESRKKDADDDTEDISKRNDSTDNNMDVAVGITRESLFFLEFDATAMTDTPPSPLRKGNFDLLVLMSTQEAIHRVLNKMDQECEVNDENFCESTRDYLKSFYSMRILSHFSGNQKYGRAEDFLEELLMSSPKIMEDEKNNKAVLIDPLNIAERILKERTRVAFEWQEITQENSEELTEIRRQQMNCMMGIDCQDEEDECIADTGEDEENNVFQ
mmetsp:Transcript_7582/g.10985  ORF Transcript_7582/g.10985 Transcript_7582/m.10985 type:complete len:481 (+) Transcript_7582:58-1500(+)|eukprot:CAMPEP_0195525796 /NCGR_PEP_ID=MMETSP0794_2-20130614/26419_1 /TAXON_ID=515487 /ORGANISM="Stephanopyxis turris, Strain CCMP 815" /LENGTH=480 /DNA_ID=CAMNT_0040656335 /DNA_START=57 /DNA_END=1499 /DNA_ORIENTATION=-